MKKLNIKIFQTVINIYRPEEKVAFEKKSGLLGSEWYGCHCGDSVWIGDGGPDMVSTCYHEAVHVADWILEERLESRFAGRLEDHTEIRAYMVQYIGSEIAKYCCGKSQ